MLDNAESTRPKQHQREVTIEIGDWVPYDENKKNETGVRGEYTTISSRRTQGKSDLIMTKFLHNDGTITEKIIDAATNGEIPRTLEYKKVNGRIEIEPQFQKPVLKYTEISPAVPVAPVIVAKK